MGSIIISRIAGFISPAFEISRWRSDDLFKLADELFFKGTTYGFIDIIGVASSFIVGIVLIYITYMLGVLWSRIILGSRNKPSQ